MPEPEAKKNASLAYQYGGNHRGGWLAYLPAAWLPYVQLARLSPPAGLFLVYFPHAFGVILGSIRLHSPLRHTLWAGALTLGGSFFVSNAAHIWNDVIDAPLDELVERTRKRPIPRGAVSRKAALLFTATQAIGAALFLLYMPGTMFQNMAYALPGIAGDTYYPWAKRHSNFPQFVLGGCLAWGTVMGSAAAGLDPFPNGLSASPDPAVAYLFLSCVLWTVIYDTIYAHQDLEDDIKAGIGSLAVLFRQRTKPLLWTLLALKLSLLVACALSTKMGAAYYLVAVGGSALSLGAMIRRVDLNSSQSCWWWFGKGFWLTVGALSGGLLLEYISSLGR